MCRGVCWHLAANANLLPRLPGHDWDAGDDRHGGIIMYRSALGAMHELPGVYGLLAGSDRGMLRRRLCTVCWWVADHVQQHVRQRAYANAACLQRLSGDDWDAADDQCGGCDVWQWSLVSVFSNF